VWAIFDGFTYALNDPFNYPHVERLRIVFNERDVPNSLEEAARIGGGQFSRAERELILSRPELHEKTIFVNR
jgi:hypothetical protein